MDGPHERGANWINVAVAAIYLACGSIAHAPPIDVTALAAVVSADQRRSR